ncbi:MAG TPA: cytochrome c oxidase subunit 3 [Acidimicrobiia bacterium]|jgi:heme/copper-type cytochrome/quinol oxidase subunit 3
MATIQEAPPRPPPEPPTAHGGEPAHPPTSTGTTNVKLAIWLFIASDCLFFGAFISAYLLYRGRPQTGPKPQQVYSIPFTSVSSFVLLMSSLTMVLALAAIQRGDLRRLRIWLMATALLGSVFVGGQIYEFTNFAHKGLSLDTNLFGSTFFVLTGFHGAHVTVGIIWLLSLWGLATQGRLTQKDAEKVEIAGLYWHFVDVVWIVIFTLVYLIPPAK